MMPDNKDPKEQHSLDDHMQLLERRANVVRSRLLRTIDALDVRRHQVTEIGHQAKKVAPVVGASALAVVALVAGSFLGIRHVVRSRKERVFANRVKRMAARFPLQIERKPSLFEQIFQKATLAIVTMAATEGTRRLLKNVLDGRLPDGRLVVGQALEAHHHELNR